MEERGWRQHEVLVSRNRIILRGILGDAISYTVID